MEIISVKEKEFKEYGKVIEGLDVAQLLQEMQKTPLPDDVIYEPSDASLEALEVCEGEAYTADCRYRLDTVTDTTKS